MFDKAKKILCAGHICLDISLPFDDVPSSSARDMFLPGSLLKVGAAKISLGGSVANTGIGAMILGGNVGLMGKVADDQFGRMILSKLGSYGADTSSMIVSDDCDTSYSVIMAPRGIDRIVLHHSGANDTFSVSDIDMDGIKGSGIFHFGYPPLMKKMYDDCGRGLAELLKAVHDEGVAVSLDMAMFGENTPAGSQDWGKILEKILPYVDFFVPSIEELCLMLDRKRYHEWLERADGRRVTDVIKLEKDIKPLADRLMDMGTAAVMIKCGAPGVYFRGAEKGRLSSVGGGLGSEISETWADREIFEKSYLVENVVSGTGAGDTTIAAFLVSTSLGYPIEDVLKLSVGTGSMCIQQYDALSGLISLDELKKKIDGGWEKEEHDI